MSTALFSILSFFLGILCAQNLEKKLEFLKLVINTFISSVLEKHLKITDVNINNAHIIKYSDIYLNTFTFHHHYDIFCVSGLDENVNFENGEFHSVRVSKTKNTVPLNFFRYKDKICHTIFKPSNLNYETLYICIRRITFNDYSVYKFDRYQYIDIENIIDKYEEYLSTPLESLDLAEAYD